MKVGFVSLGCSKNLVDTEMMIGLFLKNKYEIVNDPSMAEIIVVNTCGFIESAKEEAINTIFEMLSFISCSTAMICSTISPDVKFLINGIPVDAQNLHPILHPICEDTQTVFP